METTYILVIVFLLCVVIIGVLAFRFYKRKPHQDAIRTDVQKKGTLKVGIPVNPMVSQDLRTMNIAQTLQSNLAAVYAKETPTQVKTTPQVKTEVPEQKSIKQPPVTGTANVTGSSVKDVSAENYFGKSFSVEGKAKESTIERTNKTLAEKDLNVIKEKTFTSDNINEVHKKQEQKRLEAEQNPERELTLAEERSIQVSAPEEKAKVQAKPQPKPQPKTQPQPKPQAKPSKGGDDLVSKILQLAKTNPAYRQLIMQELAANNENKKAVTTAGAPVESAEQVAQAVTGYQKQDLAKLARERNQLNNSTQPEIVKAQPYVERDPTIIKLNSLFENPEQYVVFRLKNQRGADISLQRINNIVRNIDNDYQENSISYTTFVPDNNRLSYNNIWRPASSSHKEVVIYYLFNEFGQWVNENMRSEYKYLYLYVSRRVINHDEALSILITQLTRICNKLSANLDLRGTIFSTRDLCAYPVSIRKQIYAVLQQGETVRHSSRFS
ncbi:hypothetical protein CJP74_03815 [Psittacicella melopsittaci]|uniref:Cell division protein ZipA n=1 Tax=Psittacicella melopsittaci TaxID=2028576 RepID=A0A3A1Y338_9GAMM|nr:hypothetical protein [Psittacicella melopsittaci]RIY32742.1 hypothetical protein CJP74_03815 [Psittacicella melopsittaci]